jgi:4-deoxy-L-threo-5-hexosulose-uronate ketol-isomerase
LTAPRPEDVQTMTTEALRSAFVVTDLFREGLIAWTFTDLDRLAIAGVKPMAPVTLENVRQTGADFFLARRELGVLNVGGPAVVRCDGKAFDVNNLDCLYVGMGTKSVTFESKGGSTPAKFYLVSCPAHQTYPTTLASKEKSNAVALGSQQTANQRKIYQYIHQNGIKSCQLVMGFTELAEGSVWNTMPCHTHSRRTEIYFYFDMGSNIVCHFLGPPQATRHLFMHNDQAVLSPWWSIHTGCGTGNYRFIWAMAGENQTFDDMDKIEPQDLR